MDPARQRISDQERDQVAEVLREAAAEGRIDVEELDGRLAATFAAKSYAELALVTADLPAGHLPAPLSPGLATATPYDRSFATMSTTRRQGRWQLGSDHRALAVMGGVVLDLRDALLANPGSPSTPRRSWARWTSSSTSARSSCVTAAPS